MGGFLFHCIGPDILENPRVPRLTPTLSRLCVLAAAALFATGGAAIKSTALNSWQTAGLRSAVAALALLILLPDARRLKDWRVWALGLAYALTLVSFVHANKLTTSANAIYLQSTAPLYLMLFGPLLLRERLHKRDLWFTLALAAGMALFFTAEEASSAYAPHPALGNLWAAFSGLTYAVTLTGLRALARRPGSEHAALATVSAGNILAFVLCLPAAWPIPTVRAVDAAVLTYLGIFQIGLAYLLLTRGMRRVAAFEASTLLLLEPVLNPIVTWLVQGEQPAGRSLAGGAVILAATFAKLWAERATPAPSATDGSAARSA
jgi:drug/metabolite transporter (DMT)-like permease